MASSPRSLVVTGATGKQGGALIAALLAKTNPHQPFEIYAVTRNKASAGARRLASKPHVHVVEGDHDDPTAILSQVPQPWGLFSVTPLTNAAVEEEQGKAMTAAAIAAGVQHLVFTSVDRGVNGEHDPTPIPHFRSKFHIEKDIEARAREHGGFTYTLLRPVAFCENLTRDFAGKVFTSLWRLNGEDNKLQLISTADIGRVAAEAFLRSDSAEFRNQAVSLAGDELTPAQAEKVFREVTGLPIPATYWWVARIIKWMMTEQLGIMFDWFKSDAYGTDVAATRERFPFLHDFRGWLEEESAWKKT